MIPGIAMPGPPSARRLAGREGHAAAEPIGEGRLATGGRGPHVLVIETWPDNRAVPLRLMPGARSDVSIQTSTSRAGRRSNQSAFGPRAP